MNSDTSWVLRMRLRYTKPADKEPSDQLTMQIQIYDTTLRDGTQSEGFTLSANDKVRFAQKLDDLGVAFIEGGWPGSNPKDVEFFQRARDRDWHTAQLAAFGSTRRTGNP